MTTIPGLEEAILDDLIPEMEQELAERRDQLAEESADRFDAYAARNGYDLDYLADGIDTSPVRRRGNRVSATVSWPWGSALWEYGVSPHIIRGNPTLAFSWSSPPEGTRPPGAPSFVVADEVNWGSVTGGIPEARAIRTALQVVGQAMRG